MTDEQPIFLGAIAFPPFVIDEQPSSFKKSILFPFHRIGKWGWYIHCCWHQVGGTFRGVYHPTMALQARFLRVVLVTSFADPAFDAIVGVNVS